MPRNRRRRPELNPRLCDLRAMPHRVPEPSDFREIGRVMSALIWRLLPPAAIVSGIEVAATCRSFLGHGLLTLVVVCSRIGDRSDSFLRRLPRAGAPTAPARRARESR